MPKSTIADKDASRTGRIRRCPVSVPTAGWLIVREKKTRERRSSYFLIKLFQRLENRTALDYRFVLLDRGRRATPKTFIKVHSRTALAEFYLVDSFSRMRAAMRIRTGRWISCWKSIKKTVGRRKVFFAGWRVALLRRGKSAPMKGEKWRERRVDVDQGGKYVSGKVRRAGMRRVKGIVDGEMDGWTDREGEKGRG